MPKLLRLPTHLRPRLGAAVATTGLAAVGVATVVARNLRTMADRDRSLSDRVMTVGKDSLGAVITGPSGLVDRGREATGRTADRAAEDTGAPGGTTATGDTTEDQPVPPRGIDTSTPTSEAAYAPAPGDAPADDAPAAEAPAPAASPDRPAEEAPVATEPTAAGGTQQAALPEPAAADKAQEAGADLDLDHDLQAMTVSQLRDRAKQDGVPGRSKMNKDELVAALSTRES